MFVEGWVEDDYDFVWMYRNFIIFCGCVWLWLICGRRVVCVGNLFRLYESF